MARVALRGVGAPGVARGRVVDRSIRRGAIGAAVAAIARSARVARLAPAGFRGGVADSGVGAFADRRGGGVLAGARRIGPTRALPRAAAGAAPDAGPSAGARRKSPGCPA